VRDGKVLVGDPSSGGRIFMRADSERIWFEKILFVVRNHTSLARFDVPDQWRYACPRRRSAPRTCHRAGLADPTLMMQGPNDF